MTSGAFDLSLLKISPSFSKYFLEKDKGPEPIIGFSFIAS